MNCCKESREILAYMHMYVPVLYLYYVQPFI